MKTAVHDSQIWKLINLDLTNKLVTTLYPKEIIPPPFGADGRIDAGEMKQYKALRLFREPRLAEYKNKQTGLGAVTKLIFETTFARMINQVAYWSLE